MPHRALHVDRASPRQILARLLDDPSLVASIQSLAPRTLGMLIDRVGLEDSGEIIALATTEQLKQIFDDDLWTRDRPGKDETFDADRFALWLEVMLEAGEDFAAETLLGLPEDMVTLALHRHVLVLDIDELQVEMDDREDGKRIDKALEGYMYEEFDAYQVVARAHDRWDAILSVLIALDKHDHAFLDRVLARCCDLSSEYIDDNGGLYEVLTAGEMVESDLAAEREDRRAAEGFIAPSQAASFLALCRSVSPNDAAAAPRDAVTRAYFRELAPPKASEREELVRTLPAQGDSPDRAEELERLLAELDVEDDPRNARPVFLLGETTGAARTRTGNAIFKTPLAELHERDPRLHAERMEELAYLTNVLVSGCAVDGRSFRPFEAVVAVAATCNLGIEHLVKSARGNGTLAERAVAWLGREGAEKAFRAGFWLLHHDVALATCDAVARALPAKPSLARSRLSELDVDELTRGALEALMSDCPLLVGPLVDRAASPYHLDGEHQFIASKTDIDRVRAFLTAIQAR